MEDIEKLGADSPSHIIIADEVESPRTPGPRRVGSRRLSFGGDSRRDGDEITPIPQDATLPIEYRTL